MADFTSFLLSPVASLLQPQERLYWNYLLMAYVLAGVLVRVIHRDTSNLRATLTFLFPKRIWLQRSVLHDVWFSYLMLIMQYGFIGIMSAKIGEDMVSVVLRLSQIFPAGVLPLELSPTPLTVLATVFMTLALDFALFAAHWLLHHVPFLWPFHAVHHSAKTMTPFTGYRQHPVDTLLNGVSIGIFVGLALGILRVFFGPKVPFVGIGGQTILVLIFYLLGYHLRHSHIWLDYGPRLSRLLISPAQHQIHHSIEKKHHDKNLGYMLAIWDNLFGSLYIPNQREKLIFGIPDTFISPNPNFLELIVQPLREVFQHHRGSIVLFSLLCALPLAHFETPIPSLTSSTNSTSVELSELTSPEVGRLISEGFTTVIVPTGGTEQNGSHMILGKHNFIAQSNAEQVARRIGRTLVAPVMSYVPEGDIASKEGHMGYPGTLSMRSETFQAILTDCASSLKSHGFKQIIFMGDSGGNQSDQETVAQKLSAKWSNEPVMVVSLSDYYRQNRQADFLASLGYTAEMIGRHAGIRDTSELLYIHPEGIRKYLLADRSHPTSDPSDGSDGNTLLASQEIGKALTLLKIETAVNALKAMGIPPSQKPKETGQQSQPPNSPCCVSQEISDSKKHEDLK